MFFTPDQLVPVKPHVFRWSGFPQSCRRPRETKRDRSKNVCTDTSNWRKNYKESVLIVLYQKWGQIPNQLFYLNILVCIRKIVYYIKLYNHLCLFHVECVSLTTDRKQVYKIKCILGWLARIRNMDQKNKEELKVFNDLIKSSKMMCFF